MSENEEPPAEGANENEEDAMLDKKEDDGDKKET